MIFEYKFNEDFKEQYMEWTLNQSDLGVFTLPFDLYQATWRTFSGVAYLMRQDPLKTITIDNSNWIGDPFNIFAKQLFNGLTDSKKQKMQSSYRQSISQIHSENIEEYELKINPNTTSLESILDVINVNNQVSIRHLGSGQENLIKTKLALESEDTRLILIEEPENHLSTNNTKQQITNIKKNINESQLIVTTHNPQIISRMGIKNVLWIKNNKPTIQTFSKLTQKTTSFFERLDNLNFLNLLSAKYIVLVEGTAEYIVMETLLKIANPALADSVEVISYKGRYYDAFYELARITNARVVIFTDNDRDEKRLQQAKNNNEKNEDVRIFLGEDLETEWTFEAAVYERNKQRIEKTPFSTRTVNSELNYMLDNKTIIALDMVDRFTDGSLVMPSYIENGLSWLLNDN